MKIDHIFLAYMAVVGIATGAVVVKAPWTAEFAIKPYFWILIAAALFDVVNLCARRWRPEPGLEPARGFSDSFSAGW